MPKKSKTKKSSKAAKKSRKTKVIEPEKEKVVEASTEIGKDYFEAVGRRKTAIARVRLFTSNPVNSIGEGNLLINDKPYKNYFPNLLLQKTVESPLSRLKSMNRFRGTVKVKGGGVSAQAEAIRHGLSRALILFDTNFRKKLKKAGYLTRDSREVERKKFGLKKARRGPQWSKR
ncbi:MAG: 30S ribosomal protein S9 [Candidatus Portnoybacteria bacterium CG10_big_fil_rev_8_21_14_0_10_38_18]|uniref:Small ribosomal subunit protein uS9 n=1 Tax=Candidatus Portnoybacteria bacterium CG10_big_fil_rev_8_21_14_0_10_38_18 TaxID=1974813 RepID=A0A2M8KCU2_9BACT|nr:MAG: 30S ribosomal protein S9 [Candidatus Portnoybacteria bacterium CG10_big_fil_rev_8_21_14_0_10_38_18]